jgi:hypothetical protein
MVALPQIVNISSISPCPLNFERGLFTKMCSNTALSAGIWTTKPPEEGLETNKHKLTYSNSRSSLDFPLCLGCTSQSPAILLLHPAKP